MRVLVGVKRVIDFAVKVRVNAGHTGVETSNVKMSMNPFCEIATEEAVRWKEQKIATEVVALTVGPKQSIEVLRTALAMGADKAIHVETEDATDIQPLLLSKIFQQIIDKIKADALIVGKQAIDDDSNQLGQLVAGKLNWPISSYSSKISFSPDKKSVNVIREIDGGLQELLINLPAVFTADLRLNQPRYATLPNIMKAKKKPIEIIPLKDLKGIDFGQRLKTISINEPPIRKAGIKIDSVDDLYNKLKNEAKLI